MSTLPGPEQPTPSAGAENLPPTLVGPSPQTGDFARAPTLPEDVAGRASASMPPGYEVLGELGRGGMGVVYKARHISLGRLVALKMILAGRHAGQVELDRFRTEAQAVARLQHPNVVQIHEVGEHDGLPYFSLEFCPGGPLNRKLGGTPLPAREAATLVERLASAMQAAHDKGVVHRDLKPANVLLAEDGTPKVTDFGLAKKLDEAGLTQTGAVMGTPSYMAPEQAGGGKDIGPACDVYALGAILYECLTGRPPFKAATPYDTIAQVLGSEPAPPSRLNARVPRDLETVCLKCLQKAPARRYASAEALAEDLHRFLAGEPIQARPVGRWERARKWARRRPAAAALSAVAALAVLGLVLWAAWYNRWLREEVEREQQRAQQARQQREETRVQSERAEANFRSARDAVERMLTRVAEGPLARMPQAHEVRRKLLEDALEFYLRFLEQQGADPEVRREAARAYRRVADIRWRLGQHAQALDAYGKAADLQQQLAQPGAPAAYRLDLIDTWTNRAHLLAADARPKEAEAAYRDAVKLAEELVAEARADPSCRAALAGCLQNRGTLRSDLGRYAEAGEDYGKARGLLEELVREYPGEETYRDKLSQTLNNLGLQRRNTDRLREALALLRRAVDLKAGLSPSRADMPDSRFDLANSWCNLGMVHGDLGQDREAEAAFRKALALQGRLVEEHPAVPDYRSLLGGTLHNLGQLQLRRGDAAAARGQLESAVRQQQLALQASPRNPGYREFLRNHALILGDALVRLKEPAKASDAVALAVPLAAGWEDDYDAAGILSRCAALAGQDTRVEPQQRRRQADAYAARAVGLLRQACKKGFKDAGRLRADGQLAPLRGRDDFRQLLAELGEAAPKGSH
jgi:serine/threonine-protein kinase